MQWYAFTLNMAKRNNTLVSGNAVDEKNLYPGGRNFFLINLIEFSNKVYT